MEIIKLNIDDLEQIVEIENTCFSHPMSKSNLKESLINDKYFFYGVKADNRLIGYASVFIVSNEAYINNIAILECYRRQGFASKLVEQLVNISIDCEFITLEVRESNFSAINLYNKYGFEQITVRKNYYSNPTENAIIMTKYFGENDENFKY